MREGRCKGGSVRGRDVRDERDGAREGRQGWRGSVKCSGRGRAPGWLNIGRTINVT